MATQEDYEQSRYERLQADVAAYEVSGVISDLIVTYFDQNGDLLHEHDFPSKADLKTQKILKTIRIPKSRLMSTDESGMITLHSSCYISRRRKPAQINAHRICGDLRILNTDVVAPNLVEITGMLNSTGTIELPTLCHVGFLAHAETSRKFDPKTGWERYLNLPELLTAGTINADVHILKLPKLGDVFEDFEGNFARIIHAPQLRNVGGTLSILHSDVNFPEDIQAQSMYMSPDALAKWKQWIQRLKVRKTLRGEPFEL